MCNYGFDGEQREALKTAISTINFKIQASEGVIEASKKQIAGPRAKELEHGLFYKRHSNIIQTSEETIAYLKKARQELFRMLSSDKRYE